MASHNIVSKFIFLLVLAVYVSAIVQSSQNEDFFAQFDGEQLTVESAINILATVDKKLGEYANKEMTAMWNYYSNLTNVELATIKSEVASESAAFKKALVNFVQKLPWKSLENQDLRRQFSKMNDIGIAALSPEHFKEFGGIMNQMTRIYSTAKICQMENPGNCDLSLESDLTNLMASNRNETALKYYWSKWRKVSGRKIKPFYPKYVELGNEAARLNGFQDKSAVWLKQYEDDNFQNEIQAVWKGIKPLYQEIHAYVRRKLREKYGEAVVSRDGPIPAHLLGNMWAQSWENIADFTLPFPGKMLPDVTTAMVLQNYNASRIFKLSESSFMSMNLNAMPELFWKNSILEKLTDAEMICEPSAWDFFDGKDFRIRMCTNINSDSLLRAHHEMGHIEYYLQYKDQPIVFRTGANPGFQEAIGDMISLSISTPNHLQKIGLLEHYLVDEEASLNHLYLKALEMIASLPFAYIMDLYRWKIFRGEVTPDHYNSEWWNLAEEFQGIEPPVNRTEDDFDAACKFHVIADVEYLRYFVSNVIEFQFHQALCITAKEFNPNDTNSKPLHECDITGSKEAGTRLKAMMKMGSSKPWQDAMKILTDQRQMSSSGLMNYFRPLMNWLQTKNHQTNEYIGWKKSTRKWAKTLQDLN